MRINCPHCAKVLENVEADYPSRPFCSTACKLQDLHGWLSEKVSLCNDLETGEQMLRTPPEAPEDLEDQDSYLN